MTEALPARSIDDELDYTVDWSAWLEDGEVIAECAVECARGDTVVSRVGHDDGTVTFWLSGGTTGRLVHKIAITVTTDAAPPRTREVLIPIAITA